MKKEVSQYLERYSNPKNTNYLEIKVKKNEDLVKKWILGRPKNPYYPSNKEGDIQKDDLEYYALLDWTLPRINYKYELFEMNNILEYNKYCSRNNYKIVRSSIIPVVKINNENHWILGTFHDYKDQENLIIADFGGKCEKEDETKQNILGFEPEETYYFRCKPLNCALRELEEESRGVLTKIIKERIQNYQNIVVFEGSNYNRKEKIYFMFVLLDYNEVKDAPYNFQQKKQKEKKGEKLGNINFFPQNDIFSRKLRTSRDLTDLITNIKNKNVSF